MSGVVWSKFFWSDWEGDPKLRLCSASAQGLWMRMLCICAQSEPQGYLTLNGRALGSGDLAAITGWPSTDVEAWLDELGRWGVYSIDGKGRIFSRRMISDAKKAKTARKNGKNGGNPKLRKQRGNPASDNQNPTPALSPISHKPRAISQKSSEDKSSGAEAPPDLDAVAWDSAVLLLRGQGGMPEKQARSLFGRLLSENRIEARDLLAAVSQAAVNKTQDPAAYLRRSAAGVASRRANRQEPRRVAFV